MAILRAGPWGNLTNPHADAPSDMSVESDIFPVNCAKDNWPSQVWAAFYERTVDFTSLEYGTAALGEELEVESDSGHIGMQFCYQATQEFDIDINWLIIPTGVYLPDLSWLYNTIEGTTDSFFNTPANTGTETVTLPASTFGVFNVRLGIWSSDIETIRMSLS